MQPDKTAPPHDGTRGKGGETALTTKHGSRSLQTSKQPQDDFADQPGRCWAHQQCSTQLRAYRVLIKVYARWATPGWWELSIDKARSECSTVTTTINYILQGWHRVEEGRSSQWKISFPSKGRGQSDTASAAVRGPVSDNHRPLDTPGAAPHVLWTTSLHHQQKEECFTNLESRGDRRRMGTGDRQTQHSALLPLLLHGTNSSLPAWPTAALRTHRHCCVFYSCMLLEERQDSSFSLTILSEETAQGGTRIACFAHLCNNALQLLGHPDVLLKLLSPCLLAHESWQERILETAKCKTQTAWDWEFDSSLNTALAAPVVSYSCWEEKHCRTHWFSQTHSDRLGQPPV